MKRLCPSRQVYVASLLESFSHRVEKSPPRPPARGELGVPRAYVLPAKLASIAEKLRLHNVQVTTLRANVRVEGEEFTIERMSSVRRSGYAMTTLDGTFPPLVTRDFPAGSFYVDMAQPMANAAFYYLEPQSRDGFVGWQVLDEVLRELGADQRPVAYPIFKVRRIVKRD